MNQPDWRSSRRVVAAAALVASLAILPVLRPVSASMERPGVDVHTQASRCALAHGIKHVIFIEFDNTHFMRDIGRDGSTTVPSDLEQLPHLLNFIEGNGTLLANEHTTLISHTANDLLTGITGVYGDQH